MDVFGRKLTSRETARLLGVSEASVKRWADGGLLPMEKTAGGHRRFRPEDVAHFRRENMRDGERRSRARLAPAEDGALDEDDDALSRKLFDALVGGDDEEASSLLVRLYLRGRGVASVCDTVLAPAVRRVGDLWHEGELSVAREHLATRAALAALQSLRACVTPAGPNGLTAVCCSVEDDFHELPVQICAAVLEGAGWNVVNLGTHTPFYALAEAVGRHAPRLVCVASTLLQDLDRAAREYAEARAACERARASLVLGGSGFADEHVRRRLPAALHADNFRQLEDFAQTVNRES